MPEGKAINSKPSCATVKKRHTSFFWLLWTLLLFSLPATSFPFFPITFGSATSVRPAALYPLAALAITFFIAYIATVGRFSRVILPLLLFIAIATISTVISLVLPLESFKGHTQLDRGFRAFVSLLIGVLFYLITTTYLNNEWKLHNTLRTIYLAYTLVATWSTFQIIYIVFHVPSFYLLLNSVQRFFSIRPLLAGRASGLAFEPSWAAHQLNILLFPLLLSSVIQNFSVFRRRGLTKMISFEKILLIWSVIILVFTFSRGAIATFTIIGAIITLRSLQRLNLARLLRALGVVLVFLALVVYIGGQNPYFATLWRTAYTTPLEFARGIGVDPRLAYWIVALKTYIHYPVLGVGLGNTGFMFPALIPDWAKTSPEIAAYLDPATPIFPNPKNLLLRILSETGTVGFLLFFWWLATLFRLSFRLRRCESQVAQVVGVAGIISLAAFLLESLSLDSLALPYAWVSFGIITSSSRIYGGHADSRPLQVSPHVTGLAK